MRVSFEAGFAEGEPREKIKQAIDDFLDQEDPKPVAPRLAATVMLVRDSAPGQTPYRIEDGIYPEDFPRGQELEVFMMRRVKTMEFVPDAVVFPGGRVDERDANPALPWCGPTPAEWAGFLGCAEDDARRIVVAAAREVFEECGVLLAGPSSEEIVQDLSDPSFSDDRKALVAHELSFAEMLIRRDLVLRTDLLGLISNWCTPEFEPKRYDTFFFSALMPEGQVADDESSEARIADWVTPAYAVREADAGRWMVLMPTLYNLTAIASAKDAEEFVSSRRKLSQIMSRPVRREDGSVVLRSDFPSA